jgi:hypothetical protein
MSQDVTRSYVVLVLAFMHRICIPQKKLRTCMKRIDCDLSAIFCRNPTTCVWLTELHRVLPSELQVKTVQPKILKIPLIVV